MDNEEEGNEVNDDVKTLATLERKIETLENKCKILESENLKLVNGAKQNRRDDQSDEQIVVEDEEVLLSNKQSGFKRPNPQVAPEAKMNKKEYSCEECECKLESLGLLNAHKREQHEPKYACDECSVEFISQIQLITQRVLMLGGDNLIVKTALTKLKMELI
jgi:hypothetical protein